MATFFAIALAHGHKPEPRDFFGTAFWIGFTLQMITAEIWINYTRHPAADAYYLANAERAKAL
jgi:hypothetical protein